MIKKYFIFIFLTLTLFACQEENLLEGVFVTGDHTTVLRFWQGETNAGMNISNFQDSSSISYPAYWLVINEDYAVFYHQADANSRKEGYFALKPALKTNTENTLELSDLKLIYAQGIIAGIELIGADETKSVILNGGIEKK